MNTIIVTLALFVAFLIAAGLIGYALYGFNIVKAGANAGKAGFFIEAKGKARRK